jgi:class 3 adenylate cyclase
VGTTCGYQTTIAERGSVRHRVINVSSLEVGPLAIQIRIGVDSGNAAVIVLGSASTKRHADLIGQVVSLASKVEKHAGADGIAVGEACWRNLHASWRAHLQRVSSPADWPYQSDDRPYGLLVLDPEALEARALEC